MIEERSRALTRYAGRFHAEVGAEHHVASPLGAWLVLALTTPIDTGGPDGELAGVLGMDPGRAAETAAALLADPHPLVAAAAAAWHADRLDPQRLAGWRATLPPATGFGPLPDQAGLDRWAREHTFDLIDTFPIERTPDLVFLLASALATKVSWDQSFDVTPAAALGPDSRWASELSHVLRSPAAGHDAFVATTEQAGQVIVHSTRTTHTNVESDGENERHVHSGLHVVSVAAAPDVDPQRVLAAAYELAPAVAAGGQPGRTSLFDLPLGESSLWTITEQVATEHSTEHCHAVLPCWSATSDHDLSAPTLGFPAALRAVAALLGVADGEAVVKQAAMARYGRFGFEAAAVTAGGCLESMPNEKMNRFAELRFGHPYAVVAVTTEDSYHFPNFKRSHGPWHGVPVFSAWVSDPEDVPEADLAEPPAANDPEYTNDGG